MKTSNFLATVTPTDPPQFYDAQTAVVKLRKDFLCANERLLKVEKQVDRLQLFVYTQMVLISATLLATVFLS